MSFSYIDSKKEIDYEKLPKGLLRFGRIVIVGCLFLLVAIGWTMEYSDEVGGKITIFSTNIPRTIHAEFTGDIELLVNGEDTVKKGSYIAYAESTANFKDIQALSHFLENTSLLADPIDNRVAIIDFLEKLDLGKLEKSYINLKDKYWQYDNFIASNQLQNRIASHQEEKKLYEQYNELLKQKEVVAQKDIEITAKDKALLADLEKEGVSSLKEVEARIEKGLLKEQNRLDITTNISEVKIHIKKLERTIFELKRESQENNLNYKAAIYQALDRFKIDFHEWENQYTIKAPMSGKVVFDQLITNNQFVKKGSKICTIVAPQTTEIYGEIKLAQKGLAKVKKGQQVNVILDNFPPAEFGILKAEVVDIKPISSDMMRMIIVEFPDGFISTYNIPFQVEQLMAGRAKIITSKRSFISRVYDQMKDSHINN